MDSNIGTASSGNVDWSVFLQEGVVVTLTIKYYRGTTSMDFSELGIDDSSDEKLQAFLDEYIKPGTKCLIPPEIKGQLKSIETTARQNLSSHSFDCSAFASNGKFVPKSMYAEFKKVNEELRDRFYTIRDEFADNYDRIIEHVRKDYKVLAANLYMQSHPQAKRVSSRYVNTFVDKIIEQIASPEEIVASFEFSTKLDRIPPYILNVISKKSNIDEKVMRIATSNQPQKASKTKTKSAKVASADAVIAPADEASLDEIERDIQASIMEQSQMQAEDFVSDIVMKVRTDAIEGADAIVKSIDKNNGKLMGRASVKAHSLIDDLRKMNFYGDQELEEKVAALEEALGPDKSKRDIPAVKSAAEDLRKWSQDSLDEIYASTVDRKATSASATRKKAAKTVKKNEKPKTKIAVPKNTRRRTIKQRS